MDCFLAQANYNLDAYAASCIFLTISLRELVRPNYSTRAAAQYLNGQILVSVAHTSGTAIVPQGSHVIHYKYVHRASHAVR